MTKEDILIEGFKSFARAYCHAQVYLNHQSFKVAFRKACSANGVMQTKPANKGKMTVGQRLARMPWKIRFRTVFELVDDCGFYMAIVDKNGYIYPFRFGDDWKKIKRRDATTEELFSTIESGSDSVHESEGVEECE